MEEQNNFRSVSPKESIPKMEEKINKLWVDKDTFNKSVAQHKDKTKYVFFDGPPFANGLPHYGHILANSMKDAVTRYYNMQGYYLPRINGWDCHGLPVEYEIEKELKFKTKRDIEAYGVDKFNDACRQSVFRYTNEWDILLKRLGRWVDYDNTYATLDNNYMESIWNVFHQIWNKGLVYKGHKSMQVSTRLETPLSNFEVALGYKDVTDLSSFVYFKDQELDNTYFIAWTTTPWTLPGNLLLAVHQDLNYVTINHDGKKIVLAEELLTKLFPEDTPDIIETKKGNEYINHKYEPLFPYYKDTKNAFRVVHGDFVAATDGTGIVHIAPGFGEDDLILGNKEGVEVIQHVNINGMFKKEVTDFHGLHIKPEDPRSTDQKVVNFLEEKGKLFKSENYKHSYPHCWRTDTPLMNYAISSWFIKVTDIKQNLIDNNQQINWQPSHLKNGRFGKWLENVKDWSISRNRFWGAPIPIWSSESGKNMCINSVQDLRNYGKDTRKIILMRHGDRDDHDEFKLDSSINSTVQITEEGIAHVKETAEKLKTENITKIFVSPLLRTRQTSEIVQEILGNDIEVIFDERLIEIQAGDFDGKSRDEYLGQFTSGENRFYTKSKGGESYYDIQKRISDFLLDIDEKYRDENILVITHLSVIKTFRYLYERINFDQMFSFKFKPAGTIKLQSGKLPVNNQGEIDLHKPYIDNIFLEKDGEEYKRIPDVFDCWFESGSMPYAQLHYPFENKIEFENNFPAEFIAEGLDQTRGWFYTLHVISTILFNKPAFKNVIVNGMLLAEDGKKLSKRLKNYPDPKYIFDTYGVDTLRLLFFNSPVTLAEDLRISEKSVEELFKKFTLTLWNTYSFFTTYANIDNYHPEGIKEFKPTNNLDKWLLSELNLLIQNINKEMKEYNLVKATREIVTFVDNLSNWYIRRSRRRFWKSESDTDKTSAYNTLYIVLVDLSKALAPFTPYIADEIYKNLTKGESVHLESYPVENQGLINQELNSQISLIRLIVALGHSIRAKDNIKVRQPLSTIKIILPKHINKDLVLEYKDVILEELNIKNIDFLDETGDLVEMVIKPISTVLGPKYGKDYKNIIINLKKGDFEVIEDRVKVGNITLEENEVEIGYQGREGIKAESNKGVVVILNTEITEDLLQEGLIREFIRHVQEERKTKSFNVSDRINLTLDCAPEFKEILIKFQTYFTNETLVKNINYNNLNNGKELNLDAYSLKFEIAI